MLSTGYGKTLIYAHLPGIFEPNFVLLFMFCCDLVDLSTYPLWHSLSRMQRLHERQLFCEKQLNALELITFPMKSSSELFGSYLTLRINEMKHFENDFNEVLSKIKEGNQLVLKDHFEFEEIKTKIDNVPLILEESYKEKVCSPSSRQPFSTILVPEGKSA